MMNLTNAQAAGPARYSMGALPSKPSYEGSYSKGQDSYGMHRGERRDGSNAISRPRPGGEIRPLPNPIGRPGFPGEGIRPIPGKPAVCLPPNAFGGDNLSIGKPAGPKTPGSHGAFGKEIRPTELGLPADFTGKAEGSFQLGKGENGFAKMKEAIAQKLGGGW